MPRSRPARAGSFTEQDERDLPAAGVVDGAGVLVGDQPAPRPSTPRSAGLARQLGTTWRTVWRSIEPLLEAMADDPSRFDGVTSLGVDEHCGITSTSAGVARGR